MSTEVVQKNQKKSGTGSGPGGRRAGAGRKKGSLNQKTRAIAEAAAAQGITPLEFMLNIMRTPSDHEDPKIQIARESLRFEAAKAAAPYMHPRLAAVEVTGANGGPIQSHSVTDDLLAAIASGSRG